MIAKLVENWVEWISSHNKAISGDGLAAIRCEKLVNKRYDIIAKINTEFEDEIARHRKSN